MTNLKEKIAHVRPSWRAIVLLWQEEFSFRILAVCGGITVIASYLLHISRIEFAIVILTIGAMLAIETLNTAIEEVCDHVTPGEHPRVGKIKDIASGAAFLMWCAALLVGLVIFIPHLLAL